MIRHRYAIGPWHASPRRACGGQLRSGYSAPGPVPDLRIASTGKLCHGVAGGPVEAKSIEIRKCNWLCRNDRRRQLRERRTVAQSVRPRGRNPGRLFQRPSVAEWMPSVNLRGKFGAFGRCRPLVEKIEAETPLNTAEVCRSGLECLPRSNLLNAVDTAIHIDPSGDDRPEQPPPAG
jgi:hypothetical protein